VKVKKAFKIGKAILASRIFGAKTPIAASIIPTNRCNLRCSYCGRWERPGPELSVDQWMKIILDLEKMGCGHLSVTGGEPLLFKDLDKILAEGKKRGMSVNINTNGILLPKMKDIFEIVDSVTISLDGVKQVHDSARGEGSYDSAIRAAELTRENNKPVIFYTVLSKINLDYLAHVAILAMSMGGRAFYQPGTYHDFDGLKKNPMAPDVDQYRKAIDDLITLKKGGYPLGNSISGLEYIKNWPDKAPLKCFGGKLFLRIEADGTLRNCGRDGHLEGPKVDEGLEMALSQLSEPGCSSCWSAARVEFNYISLGEVEPIINYLLK